MERAIEPGRGGNRHPLSVRAFILDHLAATGEDYIASMHRAYKAELDRIARENGRRYRYHKPRYHSFEMQIQLLAREGRIEFSGREEESDLPQFEGWPIKPIRRFYRLK
ncbi:hypothetical protein ES703_114851 [subsurface metagenome]